MGRGKTDTTVRRRLMAALFSKGAKAGLDADYIREELAPAVIGKRLSEADNREIFKVVERVAGLYNPPPSPFGKGGSYGHPSPQPSPARGEGEKRKYDSSRAGLVYELEDAACSRWGAEWMAPLNAFVNSKRKAPTHYRFLRTAEMKAIKDRIKELNLKDGRANG